MDGDADDRMARTITRPLEAGIRTDPPTGDHGSYPHLWAVRTEIGRGA